MVDITDLKSVDLFSRKGSSPFLPTLALSYYKLNESRRHKYGKIKKVALYVCQQGSVCQVHTKLTI